VSALKGVSTYTTMWIGWPGECLVPDCLGVSLPRGLLTPHPLTDELRALMQQAFG